MIQADKSNERKSLRQLEPKLRAIREVLAKHVGSCEAYLDLGCGDGSLTEYVAKIVGAKDVCCVDLDPQGLRKASLRGFRTFQLDLNSATLPFEDSSFDLVTAMDVIEHLLNPDNVLKEAYRCLRKGGSLAHSSKHGLMVQSGAPTSWRTYSRHRLVQGNTI